LLSALIELKALLLDLLLLLLELRLRLLVTRLLVLELVADQRAASRADCSADRGSDTWCTNRAANYRTGARADHTARQGAFFPRCERLARTS
jgi:hypothetical protein